MVTASRKDSKVVRVQFGRQTNEVTKAQIVCYLRVRETGIRIYYSHHLIFSRMLPKGPWERPHMARMDLTQAMRAEIYSGVFQELFEALCEQDTLAIHPFPGNPTDDPEEVEFAD